MIKPQDFRIGNYVKTLIGYEQIEGILCDSINTYKYQNLGYEYVEQITLSEEILLKCGFIKDKESDNGFLLKVNNDWSDIYIDVMYGYCEIQVNKHSLPIPLLYVHQLQNLVFSLNQSRILLSLCNF